MVILIVVVALALVGLAGWGAWALLSEPAVQATEVASETVEPSESPTETESSESATETVEASDDLEQFVIEQVEIARQQVDLPMTMDEYTTWVSIEAEGTSVVYNYEITGLTPADIDAEVAKSSTASSACTTEDTKALLDKDITMAYHYSFEGTDETLDFSITKADC